MSKLRSLDEDSTSEHGAKKRKRRIRKKTKEVKMELSPQPVQLQQPQPPQPPPVEEPETNSAFNLWQSYTKTAKPLARSNEFNHSSTPFFTKFGLNNSMWDLTYPQGQLNNFREQAAENWRLQRQTYVLENSKNEQIAPPISKEPSGFFTSGLRNSLDLLHSSVGLSMSTLEANNDAQRIHHGHNDLPLNDTQTFKYCRNSTQELNKSL